MADIQTIEEHLGPFDKQTIAWVGDGNNVASSFVHAAARLGGRLRVATPKELALRPEVLAWARAEGADLHIASSAEDAVRGATCVVTDAWVSMHDKDAANRHNLLQPYQVNAALMKNAAKSAIFMHCLPAHRGEEVTAEVIDGPQSVVFDEAENRLHAQKAILLHCLGAA
jgi:ornithine carbamoyltransferase